MDSVPISEVSTIRDLGVTIDTKIDFRNHIDNIAKKGARLAGFVIRQTKLFKDPEIPIILFNCYVRSILEYCSPIWPPSYAVHSDRLERIQKQFLYHLSYASKLCRTVLSYESRLTHFNITTLANRRDAADIVFLHKIINGGIDCPNLLSKLNLVVHRSSSRLQHRMTFCLDTCNTVYAKNSPLYRMCSAYNKICHDLDIFDTSTKNVKRFFFT